MAFILGVVPLAISTGAGANSQRAIGTGVIGGMVTATVLGIYFVPVFFVIVYSFAARKKPRALAYADGDDDGSEGGAENGSAGSPAEAPVAASAAPAAQDQSAAVQAADPASSSTSSSTSGPASGPSGEVK